MKKRVLIVNKFYYNRGGDCVCAINLEQMLREMGHEVAVFAMTYPENIKSDYSKYFASQVEFAGGISAKLNAVKRVFGMGDIKQSFEKILDEFKPDVVHLNNIHSYLSPVIGEIAKKRGCRVIWTLHDYKLVCPAYSCTRNGKPCELCFNDKKPVLKLRCMKGSLIASSIAYLEAKKWNRKKLEGFTDYYICPSNFMASKMKLGNFDDDKLKVISNFVDPSKLQLFKSLKPTNKGDYYLYVGRLSEEKGIKTLLKAAKELQYTLKVAGGGPLEAELKAEYAECSNIQFLGHLNAEQVSNAISQARATVVPSECYENNPLSVIESLCGGTPIVGANIGGIPELITKNNGEVFTSGNIDELKCAIDQIFKNEYNYEAIASEALEKYSSHKYYERLTMLY